MKALLLLFLTLVTADGNRTLYNSAGTGLTEKCFPGEFISADDLYCVKACPSGEVLAPNGLQCTTISSCPAGQHRSDSGKECQCDSDTLLIKANALASCISSMRFQSSGSIPAGQALAADNYYQLPKDYRLYFAFKLSANASSNPIPLIHFTADNTASSKLLYVDIAPNSGQIRVILTQGGNTFQMLASKPVNLTSLSFSSDFTEVYFRAMGSLYEIMVNGQVLYSTNNIFFPRKSANAYGYIGSVGSAASTSAFIQYIKVSAVSCEYLKSADGLDCVSQCPPDQILDSEGKSCRLASWKDFPSTAQLFDKVLMPQDYRIDLNITPGDSMEGNILHFTGTNSTGTAWKDRMPLIVVFGTPARLHVVFGSISSANYYNFNFYDTKPLPTNALTQVTIIAVKSYYSIRYNGSLIWEAYSSLPRPKDTAYLYYGSSNGGLANIKLSSLQLIATDCTKEKLFISLDGAGCVSSCSVGQLVSPDGLRCIRASLFSDATSIKLLSGSMKGSALLPENFTVIFTITLMDANMVNNIMYPIHTFYGSSQNIALSINVFAGGILVNFADGSSLQTDRLPLNEPVVVHVVSNGAEREVYLNFRKVASQTSSILIPITSNIFIGDQQGSASPNATIKNLILSSGKTVACRDYGFISAVNGSCVSVCPPNQYLSKNRVQCYYKCPDGQLSTSSFQCVTTLFYSEEKSLSEPFPQTSISLPVNFTLSFTIRPTGIINSYSNILQISKNSDLKGCCDNGNRMFSVFVKPSTSKIQIFMDTDTTNNTGGIESPSLPLNYKTIVHIINVGMRVTIWLNFTKTSEITLPGGVTLSGPGFMNLAHTPYPAPPAIIENLRLLTGNKSLLANAPDCASINMFSLIDTGNCIKSCPIGTLTNRLNMKCYIQSDSSQVFKMDRSNLLARCPLGQYALIGQVCRDCPEGYIVNSDRTKCSPKSGSSFCEDGEYYHWNFRTCTIQCPAGQYYDLVADLCRSCNPGELDNNGFLTNVGYVPGCYSQANCISNGGFVSGASCVKKCPFGQYSLNGICTVCASPKWVGFDGKSCNTGVPCGGDVANQVYYVSHRTCYNGYGLNCIALNIPNTYQVLVGSSNTTCYQCEPPNVIVTSTAGGYLSYSCQSNCPTNQTAKDDGTPNIRAWALPNYCSDCIAGYIYNDTCVSACPLGYAVSGKYCVTCLSNQKISSTGTCTSACPAGFFISADNKCVEACPDGEYAVSNSNQCAACPGDTVLSSSKTECAMSCNQGEYLVEKQCFVCSGSKVVSDDGLRCLNQCPDGEILVPDTNQCKPCNSVSALPIASADNLACVSSCGQDQWLSIDSLSNTQQCKYCFFVNDGFGGECMKSCSSANPYMYGKYCTNDCKAFGNSFNPPRNLALSGNECKETCGDDMFMFEGNCVPVVPAGRKDTSASTCPSYAPILEGGYCQTGCSSGSTLSGSVCSLSTTCDGSSTSTLSSCDISTTLTRVSPPGFESSPHVSQNVAAYLENLVSDSRIATSVSTHCFGAQAYPNGQQFQKLGCYYYIIKTCFPLNTKYYTAACVEVIRSAALGSQSFKPLAELLRALGTCTKTSAEACVREAVFTSIGSKNPKAIKNPGYPNENGWGSFFGDTSEFYAALGFMYRYLKDKNLPVQAKATNIKWAFQSFMPLTQFNGTSLASYISASSVFTAATRKRDQEGLNHLEKRVFISTSYLFDLFKFTGSCNLNNNPDVTAGCLAVISFMATSGLTDTDKRSVYDTLFVNTKYQSVQDGCARWKPGFKSNQCGPAITSTCNNFGAQSFECTVAGVLPTAVFNNAQVCPQN